MYTHAHTRQLDVAEFLRSKPDVLDAYTCVMGNPGVFGEKNEIIALGKALKRNVCLYYYHGERKDGKGAHLPSEQVNSHATTHCNALHHTATRCNTLQRTA